MPIPSIEKVHDKLYLHLLKYHQESIKRGDSQPLRFTTRITNRFGRLDRGYWFHGNEDYIAISFWTGTDWMNKTPNIILVFTENACYLEISVWDSEYKRMFVDEYLRSQIQLYDWNGKYAKDYGQLNWNNWKSVTDVIADFLKNDGDKEIIDRAVRDAVILLDNDENNI